MKFIELHTRFRGLHPCRWRHCSSAFFAAFRCSGPLSLSSMARCALSRPVRLDISFCQALNWVWYQASFHWAFIYLSCCFGISISLQRHRLGSAARFPRAFAPKNHDASFEAVQRYEITAITHPAGELTLRTGGDADASKDLESGQVVDLK